MPRLCPVPMTKGPVYKDTRLSDPTCVYSSMVLPLSRRALRAVYPPVRHVDRARVRIRLPAPSVGPANHGLCQASSERFPHTSLRNPVYRVGRFRYNRASCRMGRGSKRPGGFSGEPASDSARSWLVPRAAGAILLCLSLGGVAQAGVRYVDDSATGAGTGLTWCDAFTNLQDALAQPRRRAALSPKSASRMDSINPTSASGRSRCLARRPSGCTAAWRCAAGTPAAAPNPNAQNADTYPTVLTGDLAGNDVGDRFSATYVENAYHVVTGSGTDGTAVLDGFVITAGRASGPDVNGDGGGLYNDGGSPTITDCTFTQNYAIRYSGAIRNWRSSSPVITNCRITDNSGDYGGGINNTTQSNAIITGCDIARNTTGYHGAAFTTTSVAAGAGRLHDRR